MGQAGNQISRTLCGLFCCTLQHECMIFAPCHVLHLCIQSIKNRDESRQPCLRFPGFFIAWRCWWRFWTWWLWIHYREYHRIMYTSVTSFRWWRHWSIHNSMIFSVVYPEPIDGLSVEFWVPTKNNRRPTEKNPWKEEGTGKNRRYRRPTTRSRTRGWGDTI